MSDRVAAGAEADVARRQLAVDWPACKAHGVCAEILPEIVELDEWGYPVIAPGPVPASLRRLAQRAVSSCPTMALRLVPAADGPTATGAPGTGVMPGAGPAPTPHRGPNAPAPVNGVASAGGMVPAVDPRSAGPAAALTTESSPRRRARRSS